MDRRRLTHEQAVDDLPAYIIGALDEDDADALSAHLATCATCQEEHARLERNLGLVGMAAASLEPPPGLRARLLSQLDEPEKAPVAATTTTTPPPPVSILSRLSRFGLAAAAVLLAGAVTWAVLLNRDLRSSENNLNLATQRRSNDTELLANPSRTIPLVAESSPDSYGTLYVGSEANQALLVVEDLPPTPANHTYQVWLTSGATRISAGLFTVDNSGSAMVMIDAPQPLATYQSLGITTEPGPNGSPSPTGSRVIGCPLR